MLKRVLFRNRWLPYALLFPQLLITLFFFIWPASQALVQSFYATDPFGLSSRFVGFAEYTRLLADPLYHNAVLRTLVFTFFTTSLALAAGLFLAVYADRVIRGQNTYRTLLIWPYAVAPAVAGVLWLFLFHPTYGALALVIRQTGVNWNPLLNGTHAMTLVIVASAWKQVSYNFVFFLAGLQAIPRSLIEAAAIDGASTFRRFWTIVFPLLSPTLFFLIVINVVYSFFETFGVIHAVTRGGPGGATTILVYKVYADGFVGLDIGSSAAQSVILMALVIGLTMFQFRYLERRVQYN